MQSNLAVKKELHWNAETAAILKNPKPRWTEKLPSLFYSVIIFSWTCPFCSCFISQPTWMLILEQQKMGLLFNILCIILRLLAWIISGKEHLVEFLLDFPLGKEVRNFQVFTRKFQLLEGNFKDFRSQFLTWKENKSTLHYCSSVGGKNPSKVSQPFIWLFFTPLKCWFMLLCFYVILI